jgi:WD40 repeat protein/tRNA A-37 threonylcarbamoyl transferase component Bud32
LGIIPIADFNCLCLFRLLQCHFSRHSVAVIAPCRKMAKGRSMSSDQRVLDLLLRYESLCEAGQAPTPEELCRDQPDLLAIVRERLQELDSRLGSTVDGEATPPKFAMPHLPTGFAMAEQRYRLLRLHAGGGLGEVYLAEDERLHRQVALKRMRSEVAHVPESRRRFLVEAEVTGRLEHPGVVPVYGLTEGADGQPCYAMRFIEGETLKDASASFHAADKPGSDPGERALQLRRLLSRFVAVCNTIGYAHSRGIIHRDLKPSNIMLGKYGETLVVDWGLAKPFERDDTARASGEMTLAPESGDENSDGTHMGQAVGTPAYMSPEQAAGQHDEVGPASDIYSLGATLYAILTDRPPFEGKSEGVLRRVERGEFPRPRQIRPSVPAALEAICLKAMAMRPQDRYLSALELASDVERYTADEPVLCHGEPWLVRAGRWARKHKAIVMTAAAVLFTALAGLAALLYFVNAEKNRTELQRAAADELRGKAELQSATRALERGLNLCEQGEVGRGLLWLARSLDETPQSATALRADIRSSLAEWHRPLHTLTHVFAHSEGPLNGVAFSPNGMTFLTGAEDGRAQEWDSATGNVIGRPLLHQGMVKAVAFSPDGRLILTGSSAKENKSGEARLWEAGTGEPWRKPLPQPAGVLAVAFSLDGRFILTGCADKLVRLWNAASCQLVRELAGHRDEVLAVAFSPDGKRIASAGKDKTARLWDASSGKLLGEALAHDDVVHSLAFSPDGKSLVTGSGIGLVQRWQTATGSKDGLPIQHRAPVLAVAFSPDASIILTASQDRTVRLWDAKTGQPVGQPLPFLGHPRAVAFSPDGKSVLTGSLDGSARLWKVATANLPITELNHASPVAAVAISPDGRILLTGAADLTPFLEKGEARLWNAATGKLLYPALSHPLPVVAVAFSPDGRQFATGCGHPYKGRGEVRLWETASGKQVGRPLPHERMAAGVAFSPDGKSLLTANMSGAATLWDLSSQKPLKTFRHPEGVFAVAFSPDGRTILTGADDGFARLWDLETGELTGPQFRHQALVLGVAFSPDGRRVLTGSGDYTARLWDRETGELRATFQHEKEIRPVAFSPDGKLILTGSMDHTARLWSAQTGKPVGAPFRHPSWVADAVFSPDGRKILTAGAWSPSQKAYLWNAAPGEIEGEPGRLVLWAQLITGMRLDDNDSIQILDAAAWCECQRELTEMGGAPVLEAR